MTLYKILRKNNTGIIFTAALLVAQSIHSSHAFFELSVSLNSYMRYPFAIISAIFMDALILYYIANKSKVPSYGAMVLCSILNLYSYHKGGFDWFTYDSFFAIVPSICIPFMIHKVGEIILP